MPNGLQHCVFNFGKPAQNIVKVGYLNKESCYIMLIAHHLWSSMPAYGHGQIPDVLCISVWPGAMHHTDNDIQGHITEI